METSPPRAAAPPDRIATAARWVVGLLILTIVADLATALSELDQRDIFTRLEAGEDVSFDEATASDDRAAMVGLVVIVTLIATIIAWIVWFRRAYVNVPRISEGALRFGSGWAIGAWFVPILNYFRPKQIMNDIWRAGDPDPPTGLPFHDRPVAAVVHFWWAAWIVSGIVNNFATRLFFRAETVPDQLNAATLSSAAALIDAATAVLAILVVRAVTRRYEARREQVLAPPAPPPPPPPPAPA